MAEADTKTGGKTAPDMEAFRLRGFVEGLIQRGVADQVDENLDLADLAARLDGNANAVLFRSAGPEGAEVVGNVMGSRARLADAFGVGEGELLAEVLARLGRPQGTVEVSGAHAPVQQVVWQGDDADLTRLPVPFQHGNDGGPYLSAAIDFTVNPETGLANVGCRRLMLRGRRETGIDLVTPSDLKTIYEVAAAKGERLPISFAIGAHPIDHIGATMRFLGDEAELIASLRGAPLPLVKCVSNDIRVPADAEIILEGYLDERGHVEPEGPFGEFLGYYGVVKRNPVFHLTAITMRDEPLFQTTTIGGRDLALTDSAQLIALRTEVVVWRALLNAVREPVAVHATTASGGVFNVRLSLRQRNAGEARNAIAAIFGSIANVKNVFVVDDDIDVFSDQQVDWALATRFQADRDVIVETGFRAVPLDPSLQGSRTGAKAGFDLTIPFGRQGGLEFTVPEAPALVGERFDSIELALRDGPKSFDELMAALGSRDGRDVVIQIGALRAQGTLCRFDDGRYGLGDEAGG